MTKSFIISIIVHIIIIFAFLNIFSTHLHNKEKTKLKKISLKHIVLKKESVTKKIIPKSPPKVKKEIKKKTVKKVVKKKIKKVIKKTKKIYKKRIVKPKRKIAKTKQKPLPIFPTIVTKRKKIDTLSSIKTNSLNQTKIENKNSNTLKPKTANIEKNYLKLNISKIYQAIERAKKYPKIAKKLKIQGVVDVKFTLLKNGEVINIKTSNAHKILQKAAYKTIKEASPEFPKPKEKVDIHLKIKYTLK